MPKKQQALSDNLVILLGIYYKENNKQTKKCKFKKKF